MALQRKQYPELEPQVGRILISEPFLWDNWCKRSVVLLSEHDRKEGTVGFIINKPTDMMIYDALEDFPVCDIPVYFGGRIQTHAINYIHKFGQKIEGSKQIAKGIYLGGDFEQLKLMIETHQITKDDIRFVAGYAAWEPAQLTSEIKNGYWLISNMEENIFSNNVEPEDIWRKLLTKMDSKYRILSNFPEDPSLN